MYKMDKDGRFVKQEQPKPATLDQTATLKARVKRLEAALAEKDARIAKLEAESKPATGEGNPNAKAPK